MLEITALTRRFGPATVLDDVTLAVPEGKVACLVGPSGCGKSTLLRLVAGLDLPDAGEIRLGGRLISSPGWALEARHRRLNMVFQDYALWPHMRVAEIVGYGLRHLPRAERAARVQAQLERMRIAPLAARLPAQISGGQQQRVAIARALATDPDLLLLDEPLSNLDVQLRHALRIEFAELFAGVGKTVLYVTHDPLEAASFADILVVMNAGRIEQAGPPEALFARPRSAWIATLAGYDTEVTGTLASRDAAGATIAVAGQNLRLPAAALAGSLSPGQPVRVMLRAAALDVDPAEGAELRGRVLTALFEGRDWRVALDIGGQSVTVMARSRLPAGSAAGLRLTPDAAVAFPAGRAEPAPAPAPGPEPKPEPEPQA
jgi:ABC-type Fe3+/spermidine/putrescine transport system ATPase subunit